MSLQPGTRLGAYQIVAQIGVGGMGEVYHATDTNLKRAVAIKVLPESVAADRDRLARFQREAEVLASLNHPNIAAIYGLERSDGVTALIMELVEGPTLADRIAKGPIPLDEALPIARQIAEALERLYDRFNARDMEAALATMHTDIMWANGLEGGHVCGHDGVRDYWTRQWEMMDSRAEPIGFSIGEDGRACVEVHVTARDLNANVLFDEKAGHVFQIEDGLIRRFDIRRVEARRNGASPPRP
jgi:serine/threonine protein kinase